MAYSIIALILYLLVVSKLVLSVLDCKYIDQPRERNSIKLYSLLIGVIALFFNGVVLSDAIFVNHAVNLGFSNTWALISWIICWFILLTAIRKPIENLLIIFFPVAAIGLLLVLFLPSSRLVADTVALGVKLHILLSILAYGTLAVAMCQSILLAFQEYQLHHKQPTTTMRILPPMQIMEDLLLQLIWFGFFMLSLSLIIGFLYIHNIFAQHLLYKTAFSLVTWLIFAILLWGRFYCGWRGRKLSQFTVSGFVTLTVAFFGSKLLLETILVRV